ncbi:MAG: peptide ABC transporter permease [Desulfovibrio sp. S3730MH75]|nr:MAG: peptide ABC transporter permease [Desulfovibrio sp. S3730MH75]
MLVAICLCINLIITNCYAADSDMSKELIVLAAPISGDPYYADVLDDIFNFQVNYARQIKKSNDDVLILVDEKVYERYAEALGNESVAVYPFLDIWMRDYGLSNAAFPVMFRYTSEAQGGGIAGQNDADAVQNDLSALAKKVKLTFREIFLLNDGGNFVDDYEGNVVISRKFLRDNNLTESQAYTELSRITDVKNVAFIESDEQGGLEHADGVVAFVDTNTVIINSYTEDPEYAQALKNDLKRGLPDVIIYEVVTPYDAAKIYDKRFGSACGLYTNALVTPNRIYLPQFGIPEDKIALEQVRAATTREVVPVSSAGVCVLGGGVRCMSWQLRGKNARALLRFFE